MNLPINTVQTFTTTLPRSKQLIEYRQYLVKEDKLFSIAYVSEDKQDLVDTLIQVMTNCTFDKINIKKLDIVDLTWLLIKLREASRGDIVDISIKCGNVVDGSPCGHTITQSADLKDIRVSNVENVDSKIEISDKIIINLKTVGIDSLVTMFNDGANIDDGFDVVKDSIDYVYNVETDTIHDNFSEEDIDEFLDSLTTDQFKKITEFVKSTPKVELEVNFTCPKCNNKENLIMDDLLDFLE